jgi:hypothetical protein
MDILADPPFHLGALRPKRSPEENETPPPPGCHYDLPEGTSSLTPGSWPQDRYGRTLQHGDLVRILAHPEVYLIEDLCETPEGVILLGLFPALHQTAPRAYTQSKNVTLYPEGPQDICELEELEPTIE